MRRQCMFIRTGSAHDVLIDWFYSEISYSSTLDSSPNRSFRAISVLFILFFSLYSLTLTLTYLPFLLHFRHLPLLITPPCMLFSYLSTLRVLSSLRLSLLTPLVWILRRDIDLALQLLLQQRWTWVALADPSLCKGWLWKYLSQERLDYSCPSVSL